MSLKDTLNAKIAELKALATKIKMGAQDPPPGGPPAPESYTCADGTIIQIAGGLTAGNAVMIVGADGAPSAAPAGDYTLEDGTVITVDNGMIGAVTPGVGMSKETPLDEKTLKAINDAVSAAMTAPAAEATALRAEVAILKTQLATQRTEFANLMADAMGVVEEIAKEPAADPVGKPSKKQEFTNAKTAKIDAIAANLKEVMKAKNQN